MRKVSLRLPPALVNAYDRADGTRSAVMRRVLAEAVAEGEVEGVPDDLQLLAERERAVEDGELARKAATFKERCYRFFADKWEGGLVTPADAERLADSWRDEAVLYGPGSVAFVDEITAHWRDSWRATGRGEFPDPATFLARVDPDTADPDDRLTTTLRGARENGYARHEAVDKVSKFHPDDAVREAAREVWDE